MKRILLFAFITLTTAVTGFSQCTPDPLYADSLFGVWPDTTTNFISGQLNVAYSQQLDIAVPSSTGQVPALGIPFDIPIDSGVVVSVTGLPAGLSYACASQTPAPCTYLGGTQGCAVVSGTPTESGLFELVVTLEAFALGGISQEIEFEGYRVFVLDPLSVDDVIKKPVLSQNIPNPFVSRTTIPFSLNIAEVVDFKVLDLLGQEVYSDKIDAKYGQNEYIFEAGNLESGIYLYAIESSAGTITRRMVLDRP